MNWCLPRSSVDRPTFEGQRYRRPDPEHGARTPIQVKTVAFGDFVDQARRELNTREWITLVSTIASWAAHESAQGLEDEERPA